MSEKCPLCREDCIRVGRDDPVSVKCKVCQSYLISARAIKRVENMTIEHGLVLSSDAKLAYSNGKILEIRLAPVGSERVFNLIRHSI